MRNTNECGSTAARKSVELHLLVEYVFRPVAVPISRWCVQLGISANTVTVSGGIVWFCSIPSLLIGGAVYGNHLILGTTMVGLASFFWVFGFLLDVVDGGVARLTGASGLAGSYLDYCFHLLFNPLFLASLGCFLYVVDGVHVMVPILGLLGSAGNWGPTFAALDQMTIADAAVADEAGGDGCLARLVTVRGLERKAGARRRGVVRQLSEEVFFFPGQFVIFFLAVLVDLFLPRIVGLNFPVTLCLFLLSCVILVVSLPFRIYREFCAAKQLGSDSPSDD